MKRLALLLLLFLYMHQGLAQKLELQVAGISEKENKIIDSVSYQSKHADLKSIRDEIDLLSQKLTESGFIASEIIANSKINDSLFQAKISLGKKTKFLHIYIGSNTKEKTATILDFEKDTLKIIFSETRNFLDQKLAQLEQSGFSLAKIKLDSFQSKGATLFAELKIDLGIKRQVNDIVINGYDKFPEGHRANIKRLYKNKTFNQETLKKINNDFDQFRFVSQIKYPEILFTKDTTKIYVYLEKAKPNKFEGFIGFSNDENTDVNLNGYLDLFLVNTLNSGEEFTLYWKSDGNDQKTFNLALELPYIFKSRFGLKANLNIFKQDSTFQNTKTALDLGYYFNYNTRLYLGYQSTESSDIQNQNNFSISDYKNTFVTTNFEFIDFKTDDFLFPEKTRANLKAGVGSRDSKTDSNQQLFIELNLKHNIYLDKKNVITIKSQNYFLKSDTYIINELYRFGGINSIRGFNENSLQANLLTSLLTEYRYVITPSLYLHSIIDYGYFKDKTTETNGSLLGIGFGFGLLTKNGLLNLVYANGSTDSQEITLSNSIVHISFRTNF